MLRNKNAVWVGLGILGLAAVLFFRFCKGDCPKPEGLTFKSYITENETLLVYEWEPAENASSYRFTFTLGDQQLVDQNITGTIATVVLRGDLRGFGRDYIATVAANCRFNRHSAADTSICRAPKKIGIGDISLKGDTIKLVYPGGTDNYGIQFRVKRGGKTIYSLVDGCGYKKVRSKSVIVIPDVPLAVGDTLIYRLALDCNGAFSDESKGIDIFDNGVVTSEIDIFDDTDDFPEECLPCEGCPYIKFRIGATIPSKGGTATVDSSYVWKVYNKQAFCDCLFEPHSSAYCLQNLVGQIYTGNDLPECICNDDDDF